MDWLNLTRSTFDSDLYLIKNKDIILGSFSWMDEDTPSLEEDSGLPTFISYDVVSWIISRTPPKHRAYMDVLLGQLGLSSLKSIVDFSKGLALTDTLWVCESSQTFKWEDVSLFRNPFDEVIARIAFEGGMHGLPFSTTSPEIGTNGMLAKCWVRNKNANIFLMKTGTTGASNAGNEPYSENLAHQVLTRLGYYHVPYSTRRYRGKLVSLCPLFTSEEIMFLPIWMYYNFRSIDKLVSLCKEDGVAKGLAQHLIFDFLSLNVDRHAGNLGVILDADNFKLLGFAPIFDNGMSMLNFYNGTDDLNKYTTESLPALYDSFERGAKLGKSILGKNHNVEKLIGFKFDRSQVSGYKDNRIDIIEEWLQKRVQKFLQL